ncbi:hypothetical protein [Burkholderia sp. BCC1977]|uniref:hypothetical protein n=1 Tax=Burkholderia sp. BCC1977 TaxID=2817440 RepID=UPI002ABE798C|nr:hypothetical protein [Burkholderia sp. BCC1977]
MTEFATLRMCSVSAMEMSEDGEFVLVHGAHSTLSLHRSTFNALLVALPNAIEHSARRANKHDGAHFVMPSTGWEIGRIDDTPHVFVRFHLQGGPALGFSVPGGQVPAMLDALCKAAGIASILAPPPGATFQ